MIGDTVAAVRIVGRYALYEPLASGGMATVYIGRLLGPVGFARTVAVKRLHPRFASNAGFVAMFLDEARMAARIRHPNVVQTLDVVATDGELFLVMDYVHGESLNRLLRLVGERHQHIPVPVVVAIVSGVLQGLDAAHEAKSDRGVPMRVVHRDVSPQNVLVGVDGQARLLDFGVARAVGRIHNTMHGEIKGKVAYMPPEQLRGSEVGPETDVYAAAVVLWEALVGRRLFMADTAGALAAKVLAGDVLPPSVALIDAGERRRAREVAALDGVVMRGLSHAQGARWQTARQLSRALEELVSPATNGQVSDWIGVLARDALQARSAVVERIESQSAVDPTAGDLGRAIAESIPDAHDAADSSVHVATVSLVVVSPATPPPPPARRPDGSESATLPAPVPPPAIEPAPQVTPTPITDSALVASSAWPPAQLWPGAPRPRVRLFGALGAATLAALLGVAAFAPRSPSPAPSAAAPSTVAAAVPVPDPPASFAAAAPVPAPPPAASTGAPRVEEVATPGPRPSSTPARHPGTRAAEAPRAATCDPPFVFDAKGMKRYKPECF